MEKIDKIQEFIDRYKEELKKHYKEAGKLEYQRENLYEKFSYSEGNNDAYINAKETFIEELEELKKYYSNE